MGRGDVDRAVPLLRANIKENHGPSTVALARHFAGHDAGEALRLISQACRQGVDGAGSAFADIRSAIEERAAAGAGDARMAKDFELDGAVAACTR